MAGVSVNFYGQNMNHKQDGCLFSSLLPRPSACLRLIRHTLISLLFSSLSDFLSDSIFLPEVFV